MINISGSYSIGGKSHRNLAAQVDENTKDIKYLLDNGVLPKGTKNIEENGEYEVKKYANKVTETVHNDGVAVGIKKFIFNN